MTSAEVRSQLVDTLRLDLVGPERGHELESEVLPAPPSRWYLTGFLVPHEAAEQDKRDETADEQLDLAAGGEGTDDDAAAEQESKRKVFFPASIGISTLLGATTTQLTVTAEWGDYTAHGGLVQAGRRIERYLRDACELGTFCSNDPVCALHDPADAREERFLNGAA